MTTPVAKTTSLRVVSPSDVLEAGLLTYRGVSQDETGLVLFLGAEVLPQLGVTGMALVKINSKAQFRVAASFGCLRGRVDAVDGVSLYGSSPLAEALANGYSAGPLDHVVPQAGDEEFPSDTHCIALRVGGTRPLLAVFASRFGPLMFDEHTTSLFSFAIESYLADASGRNTSTGWSDNGEDTELSPLTPRQVSILDLIRQSKTNREIGRDLSISEALVKHEIRLILKALGVANRVDATIAATKLGLMD